jgi:putative GTP pyrophosphokinase
MTGISAAQSRRIDSLVQHYLLNQDKFSTILYGLSGYVAASKVLGTLVHSVKLRTKDPEHLRAKLVRKLLEAKGAAEKFDINKENLFMRINDLAGFRIIHLHNRQAKEIHDELLAIFDEQRWILVEGPVAKTWDDESRAYFRALGWQTEESESMYTSVHYVVQPNRRSELTCEIQVRTLMEEVWGEVDHTINYPVKSASQSCREQIKVLARLTSSCSRLVDSIFLANLEAQALRIAPARPKRAPTKKVSAKRRAPATLGKRRLAPRSS